MYILALIVDGLIPKFLCMLHRYVSSVWRYKKPCAEKIFVRFQLYRSLEVQDKTWIILRNLKIFDEGNTRDVEARCQKYVEWSIISCRFRRTRKMTRNYACYRKLAKIVKHDGTMIVTVEAGGTVRRELNSETKPIVHICVPSSKNKPLLTAKSTVSGLFLIY